MKFKKILIGIDNSKFAEHGAEYGFDIAHSYKAHVGLVHVVEPMTITPNPSSDIILGTPPQVLGVNEVEMMNIQTEASESLVERTARRLGKDLEVTHFNQYGDTADGIINCAKEFKADLIVIGTHSRSGIDRLLMGSVAEHVVRHSPIPVLVVPSPEDQD